MKYSDFKYYYHIVGTIVFSILLILILMFSFKDHNKQFNEDYEQGMIKEIDCSFYDSEISGNKNPRFYIKVRCENKEQEFELDKNQYSKFLGVTQINESVKVYYYKKSKCVAKVKFNSVDEEFLTPSLVKNHLCSKIK